MSTLAEQSPREVRTPRRITSIILVSLRGIVSYSCRIRATLDEHRPIARLLAGIAHGRGVKLVAVTPHAPRNDLLHAAVHRRNEGHRSLSARGNRPLEVFRRRQERQGSCPRGARHIVAIALVVEIETILGPEILKHPAQDTALGSRKSQCIAVQVDAQRVAAAEKNRPVGIEHRGKKQGKILVQTFHVVFASFGAAFEKVQKVEYRPGSCRFVAVHLRPKQDTSRSASELHRADGPSEDRCSQEFRLRAEGLTKGENSLRRDDPFGNGRLFRGGIHHF